MFASVHACGQHGSQACLGVAGRRSMTRGQGAARPRVFRGCALTLLAALLLLLEGVAPSPAPAPRTPPPAGPPSTYWHPDSAPRFPPTMHQSCMSCMQGAYAHLCKSVRQLHETCDSFFSTLPTMRAAGPLLDLKNSVSNWDDFVAGRSARGWDWGSPCRPVLWSFVTCNSDDRVVELCAPAGATAVNLLGSVALAQRSASPARCLVHPSAHISVPSWQHRSGCHHLLTVSPCLVLALGRFAGRWRARSLTAACRHLGGCQQALQT